MQVFCCCCCCFYSCVKHNEQHYLFKFHGTSRWHCEQFRITTIPKIIALFNKWVLRPSRCRDRNFCFGSLFQWLKWIVPECFSIILDSNVKTEIVNSEQWTVKGNCYQMRSNYYYYSKQNGFATEKYKRKQKQNHQIAICHRLSD